MAALWKQCVSERWRMKKTKIRVAIVREFFFARRRDASAPLTGCRRELVSVELNFPSSRRVYHNVETDSR